MTTHRRYTYVTSFTGDVEQAAQVLAVAEERHWWFTQARVDAAEPLTFSFVVKARDQWFANTRATRLAVDVLYAAGGSESDVPPPDWVKLPPHTNRGFLRTSA